MKPGDDEEAEVNTEEAPEDVPEEITEEVVQEEVLLPDASEETEVATAKTAKKSKIKAGTEIRIPETADEEPIELIFEEPTLF